MTNVVLDTSAVVKILASPKRSVQLARILQTNRLFSSDHILKEIEYVLLHKINCTKSSAKSITLAYQKLTTTVRPKPSLETMVRDKSDQPILDLCVSVRAEVLVTNDKDLLECGADWLQIIAFEKFMTAL